MKNSFNVYFKKLANNYQKTFNSKPTVSYTEKIDKEFFVSDVDSDGYVEWQPIEVVEKKDWTQIETKLGFNLSKDLKEYYSSYLFLELQGDIDNITLNFYPLENKNEIDNIIYQHFIDGQWAFKDSQQFLIGNATFNNNDNYFIYYNNKNNELFIYDKEENDKVLLGELKHVIKNMEAPFN